MGKLWSYNTGTRGVSAVRVYERRPNGPLQVEWYRDGQRFQRSLRTVTGEVVLDRRLARAIADRMSAALERGHAKRMNEVLFGVNPNRTLGQLFGQLHAQREKRWSKSYTRDQKRYRNWWLDKLGGTIRLVEVTAGMVEAVVGQEAKASGWSERTQGAYLRYIIDAFYYAERKLKWIEQRHNLSNVDIPTPTRRALSYGKPEIPKLLRGLEEIGEVPGWLGHTLYQSGRRLTAARTLPKAAVTVEAERSIVEWPMDTDKARKGGFSVLVGRAHELTALLMKRPGTYVAGTAPPDMDACQDWMREAEKRGGVPHKDGRLWHGIKRRFADRTSGMKGRSIQAGTREDTLRHKYDPRDDVEAAERVARRLAEDVE